MANKSAIKTTPLVGELNLSQNKLDTIPIGDSGYLHNDGVLYGNILSPVYKKGTGYDAEYYDKDGHKYDVTYHSIVKDGNSVMTFTNKKLTETKLDVKNLLSYDNGDYVRVVDTTLYINISDTEYDFSFVHTDPDWSISSVLTARSIKNFGALILYIGTDGKYYISMWKAQGQEVKEQLTWTEVNSPLITWYKKEDGLYFLTCYSDSGADFQGTASSYAYKYATNPTEAYFKPIIFEPKVSQTQTVTTSTSYYFKDFFMNKYPATEIHQQRTAAGEFVLCKQNWSAGFPYAWINPCDININFYFTTNIHYESYLEGAFKLAYGSTYDELADLDITNISTAVDMERLDTIDTDTFTLLPLVLMNQPGGNATFRVGNSLVNPNDKSSFNVSVDSLVYSSDVPSSVSGDPVAYWKKNNIPSLFFMDGDNNDKKAVGVLWCEVEWQSNNVTLTKRFKIMPQTNIADPDTWRNGWDYTILFRAQDDVNYYIDSITSQTTSTVTDTPLAPLNAFLDGGKLICTDLPVNATGEDYFAKGLFGFTGAIDSVTEGGSAFTIKYNADGSNTFYVGLVQDTEHAYPYRLISRAISLDKNYFRYMLRTKGFGDEIKDEEGNVTKAPAETDILYDSTYNKIIINPGYNSNTGTLKTGAVYQKGPFRILYNNNVVSNISYGNNDKIGTLLCDWDIIDEILDIHEKPAQSAIPDYIVIRDIYGNIIKYSWETVDSATNEKPPFTVILDRFIVINTTSYYNCYDIKTGAKLHYASDYNNRFLMGIECYDYLKQNSTNDEMFEKNDLIQTISGSNQNGNYQITNDPISSYSVAPEVLENMWMVTNPFMLKCEDATQAIDIYLGFQNVTATYFTSYKNGAFVRDTALDLAYMSTDTLYNPNIFTRYIHTFSFNDMIINSATNTAYPLNKYNGQMFLSYQLTSGIENAENVFVVQTLIYYISDNKIWEAYYANGVLENVQAIAAIKGLKYLGCLPTEAIFWSPIDRTFWSFGGDAILRKVIQANDISMVYNSWYNEGTQELFVATNRGLLCLNNINNYMLTDYKNVSKMWFFDTYFIAKNTVHTTEGDETEDYKIAYEPTVLNEDAYMHLTTKWFGSTENYKTRFDCIYFRLAKPALNVTPKFTITSTTMTDISTESDTKTIEPTFDEDTNTAYIRYQQPYQRAVATKYTINTNCPLISWAIGFEPLEETGSLSTINI